MRYRGGGMGHRDMRCAMRGQENGFYDNLAGL